MKIAFFSPLNFSPTLGATKNRLEAGCALSKLGWEVVMVNPSALGLNENYRSQKDAEENYSMALKNYLQSNAHEFDVVLYEYDTLPFPRNLFSPKTLFIARPALLFYHFQTIKYPVNLKSRIKKVLSSVKENKREQEKKVRSWEFSLEQADVVQVQNQWDKKILVKNRHPEKKIIVVPNGLSPKRRFLLGKSTLTAGKKKSIAFVGTFDFRKGACDFPTIVSMVLSRFPDYRFKFLGTKGLFQNEKEVEKFFSKNQRKALSIYPSFSPEDLPELLSDCCLGIFPSYIESFGYGVLEMMAAGLPVVCYNSPGPSDFVPPSLLVHPGRKKELARKVIELLENQAKLKAVSQEVLRTTENYCWDKIGLSISHTYQRLHKDLLERTSKEYEGSPLLS